MKQLLLGICCFVLAMTSSLCPAGRDSIKLGALFNLTGGMAAIDGPGYRGAKLAAKLINKAGGLLDGRNIELVVVDTKTDETEAVKAAKKLVSLGVAAGLGYMDSNFAFAVGPVFNKAAIPFVTSGATDPQLPGRVGPFMFMAAYGDDSQAAAMAHFAVKTRMIHKAALWTDTSTVFTRHLSRFFRMSYLAEGGRILGEHPFKHGQKDFSALVRALQAMKPQPDAIFIAGDPADAVPTVQQLRTAGVKMPILSGDGFDCDLMASLPQPGVCEHIYFTTHAFVGSSRPEVSSFVQAYRKEYGKDPETAFAALGFDSVNLIASAIARSGSTKSQALREALSATRGFDAVTGAISYTPQSRVPKKPVAIIGIKKGKYDLLETWTP